MRKVMKNDQTFSHALNTNRFDFLKTGIIYICIDNFFIQRRITVSEYSKGLNKERKQHLQ